MIEVTRRSTKEAMYTSEEIERMVVSRGLEFVRASLSSIAQVKIPEELENQFKFPFSKLSERFRDTDFNIAAVRNIYLPFESLCEQTLELLGGDRQKDIGLKMKLFAIEEIMINYAFLQLALGDLVKDGADDDWNQELVKDDGKVIVYSFGDYPRRKIFSKIVGEAVSAARGKLLDPFETFHCTDLEVYDVKLNINFLIQDKNILKKLDLPQTQQFKNLIYWMGEFGLWQTTLTTYMSKAEARLSGDMLRTAHLHEEIHMLQKRAILSYPHPHFGRWRKKHIIDRLTEESFLWETIPDIWCSQMIRDKKITGQPDFVHYRLMNEGNDSLRSRFRDHEEILTSPREAGIWALVFGYMLAQLIGIVESNYDRNFVEKLKKCDPSLILLGNEILSSYFTDLPESFIGLDKDENLSLSFVKYVLGEISDLDVDHQKKVIQKFLKAFDENGLRYVISIFEWNEQQNFLTQEEMVLLSEVYKFHKTLKI